MFKTGVAHGSNWRPTLPTAATASARRNPDRCLAPMRPRPDNTECRREQRILSGSQISTCSASRRSAGARDSPIAKVGTSSRKATLRFETCPRAKLCPDPPPGGAKAKTSQNDRPGGNPHFCIFDLAGNYSAEYQREVSRSHRMDKDVRNIPDRRLQGDPPQHAVSVLRSRIA